MTQGFRGPPPEALNVVTNALRGIKVTGLLHVLQMRVTLESVQRSPDVVGLIAQWDPFDRDGTRVQVSVSMGFTVGVGYMRQEGVQGVRNSILSVLKQLVLHEIDESLVNDKGERYLNPHPDEPGGELVTTYCRAHAIDTPAVPLRWTGKAWSPS